MLINESGTSIVNVSSMAIVKIKPSDYDVLMPLDLDDDVCHVIDLYDTSRAHYRTTISYSILISMNIDKIPYNPLYMKLACHISPSQHPHLHLSLLSSGFNIVNALKLTSLEEA